MKSGRIKWAGHVARGVTKATYRVLVGKPEERKDNFENLGVEGRIILKLIIKKLDLRF
jgi:hypothetical protein